MRENVRKREKKRERERNRGFGMVWFGLRQHQSEASMKVSSRLV